MIIFGRDRISETDSLELSAIGEYNISRISKHYQPFRVSGLGFTNDFTPHGYEKDDPKPLALALCETNSIIFNLDAFLTNPTIFKNEILVHEICHLADYQIFGKFCHGKTWKELMKFSGLKCRLYYCI